MNLMTRQAVGRLSFGGESLNQGRLHAASVRRDLILLIAPKAPAPTLYEDAPLLFRGSNEGVLADRSRGKPFVQRAPVPPAPPLDLFDLLLVTGKKRPKLSDPPLCLGVCGVPRLSERDDVPDRMQFPVFSEQVVAAQPPYRHVPYPHDGFLPVSGWTGLFLPEAAERLGVKRLGEHIQRHGRNGPPAAFAEQRQVPRERRG